MSPSAENSLKYPQLWVTGTELQIVNAKKNQRRLPWTSLGNCPLRNPNLIIETEIITQLF